MSKMVCDGCGRATVKPSDHAWYCAGVDGREMPRVAWHKFVDRKAEAKRLAEVRRGECYRTLMKLCEGHGADASGADDVLFCLSVVLRDRAEATGSERYEAAAEDVARAYERRAGGDLGPEKGRAK